MIYIDKLIVLTIKTNKTKRGYKMNDTKNRFLIGTSRLYIIPNRYSSFSSAMVAARREFPNEEVNIYFNKPNGFSVYDNIQIIGYKTIDNKAVRL